MAGSTQTVSLYDPQLEMQQVERRRKLADSLGAQAAAPIEQQTAGGYVIPVSPWQGLAKLAQGAASGYMQRQADDQQKQIAQRVKDQRAVEANQFAAILDPNATSFAANPQQPEQPTWLANAKPSTMTDATESAPPPTPLTKQQRLSAALQFEDPQFRAAALTMLQKDNEEKFGHTPQIEMINGQTHSVLYGDKGTRKVIGPVKTRDKFNTQSADSVASLAQAQQHWSQLSPYQQKQVELEAQRLNVSVQQLMLDRARLQNQNIQTAFDTGSSAGVPPLNFSGPQVQFPTVGTGIVPQQQPTAPVGAMPGINPAANPPQRQAAPQQPAFASGATLPNGQPLPGKYAAQVAVNSANQINEMNNKRQFNMSGINDSLTTAENILKGIGRDPLTGQETIAHKPTSSGIGSMADSVGNFFGKSLPGAAQAAQLASIGGALVAKMPRMEGPQSDKDVLLYKQMAGQIGDPSVPIPQRLAALQTVRDLYAKYEGGQQPQVGVPGAQPLNGITERRAQPRNSSGRVVVDF